MDKEARRNGLIGSGHGRKNIGLSNIDGGHIPSIDDIGTQKSDDDFADHGKMSTWGMLTTYSVYIVMQFEFEILMSLII